MTAEMDQRNGMMRITILFGGTSKERLVSVASAQALHQALPDAELWFWDSDNSVHEAEPAALLAPTKPFEEPFKPATPSLGARARCAPPPQRGRGSRKSGQRGAWARSSRRSTEPRPRSACWCWDCMAAS